MVLIYKKFLHFKLNREIIHLIVVNNNLMKLNKYINFIKREYKMNQNKIILIDIIR